MSFFNKISLFFVFTSLRKPKKRGKDDRNDNQEFQNKGEFRRPLLSFCLIIADYAANNWICEYLKK